LGYFKSNNITRIISLQSSLFGAPTQAIYYKGNTPKFYDNCRCVIYSFFLRHIVLLVCNFNVGFPADARDQVQSTETRCDS